MKCELRGSEVSFNASTVSKCVKLCVKFGTILADPGRCELALKYYTGKAVTFICRYINPKMSSLCLFLTSVFCGFYLNSQKDFKD